MAITSCYYYHGDTFTYEATEYRRGGARNGCYTALALLITRYLPRYWFGASVMSSLRYY